MLAKITLQQTTGRLRQSEVDKRDCSLPGKKKRETQRNASRRCNTMQCNNFVPERIIAITFQRVDLEQLRLWWLKQDQVHLCDQRRDVSFLLLILMLVLVLMLVFTAGRSCVRTFLIFTAKGGGRDAF
ncbi:hypothetical protein GQ42DRAFT_14717 [Ramicandelaber brevisporus]|nr:hypothetical protein GQ42DRAFT_14717 [Ramicandelaber brevisporus]